MLNQIKARLTTHQPRTLNTRFPQAAVLIPITQSTEPRMVLTRRAVHLSSHGGEVAFPGGKREPDDLTLEMTALRESHEEIGLPPSAVSIMGRTGTVVSLFGLSVTPFVGVVPDNVELTPNLDELDSIFQVPLHFLLDRENLRMSQANTSRPYPMPSYQFGEFTIWGLTAIMIIEFLNITLDADIPLTLPPFKTRKQA